MFKEKIRIYRIIRNRLPQHAQQCTQAIESLTAISEGRSQTAAEFIRKLRDKEGTDG